jgi:hypothetical protein
MPEPFFVREGPQCIEQTGASTLLPQCTGWQPASDSLFVSRDSQFVLIFVALTGWKPIPHLVVFVALTGWKPIPHLVVFIALTGWKPISHVLVLNHGPFRIVQPGLQSKKRGFKLVRVSTRTLRRFLSCSFYTLKRSFYASLCSDCIRQCVLAVPSATAYRSLYSALVWRRAIHLDRMHAVLSGCPAGGLPIRSPTLCSTIASCTSMDAFVRRRLLRYAAADCTR